MSPHAPQAEVSLREPALSSYHVGPEELSSGCQTSQQAPLPAEPCWSPCQSILKHMPDFMSFNNKDCVCQGSTDEPITVDSHSLVSGSSQTYRLWQCL